MIPEAQLLTIPTTFPNYKPKDSSLTAKSVIASNCFLLQIVSSITREETEFMAHHSHRSSRIQVENELWFNMSASARQQQEHRRSEQSAYQTTAHRMSTTSSSSRIPPRIPTISTSSDLNKPLPPSPSSSEKAKRKPASLSGFLRRESSSQLVSTHLQPGPYQQNQRHSTSLSVDTSNDYRHHYSHSTPSSPYDFGQASVSHNSADLPRAHSAAANYPDMTQYEPYSLPPQHQSGRPLHQQRTVSMNPYFEATPSRCRTFPEHASSPTARESCPSRPRPHTTLFSPTEPFADVSQFHLFAEAMTGISNNSEPWSPNGPPQLQGSLFARRSANDSIPFPLQHSQQSTRTQPTRRPQRDDWLNFEPPPLISTRSTSAQYHTLSVPNQPLPQPEFYQQWQPPSHMDGVSAELEMLGLSHEHGPDEELPDYQQSQAEMAVKKRLEASARAKELEARWRGTRR